jgi:hypothetical protein
MERKVCREELEVFAKRGNVEYDMGYTGTEIETMPYEILDQLANQVDYLDGK